MIAPGRDTPFGCGPGSLLEWVEHLVRRVSYPQAEAATSRLAARLVDRFSSSELSGFRFTAIPAGGLIVLGMLAYVLNLDRQAVCKQDDGRTLVIVDDCSLTGNRFARFLQRVQAERVVFAHLYSHPELRRAIREQESRVDLCLAADDLRDVGRQLYPSQEEYRAWQTRWQTRLGSPRYWMGMAELVIFPWNEPDHPVWNPVTEEIEDNWRWTAPDCCLKNWGQLGVPPRPQVHPTLRVRDDVAYNVQDGEVLLCDLRSEQIYGVRDVAAAMWRALAAYGDLDAAATYLLGQYEVEEDKLRQDLCVFADDLLARGLFERVDEPVETSSQAA